MNTLTEQEYDAGLVAMLAGIGVPRLAAQRLVGLRWPQPAMTAIVELQARGFADVITPSVVRAFLVAEGRPVINLARETLTRRDVYKLIRFARALPPEKRRRLERAEQAALRPAAKRPATRPATRRPDSRGK